MKKSFRLIILSIFYMGIIYAEPPCMLGADGVYISEAFNGGISGGATGLTHFIEVQNDGEIGRAHV